jgi:hypothetical protein
MLRLPKRVAASLGAAAAAALIAASDAGAAGIIVGPPQAVSQLNCRERYAVKHHKLDTRGVAILSPIECPDAFDIAVGGKPLMMPYYRGYCPYGPHGAGANFCANCFGLLGVGGGPTPIDSEAGVEAPPGYNGYSGARRDEDNLLHLGGLSGEIPNGPPRTTTPDLIDLIQSGH